MVRGTFVVGVIGACALVVFGLAVGGASGVAWGSPTGGSPFAGDVFTYDYDNTRSGDDVAATRIAGLSRNPAWNDDSLDGAVFGEPLVDDGTVYVATEADTVYAISLRTGAIRWKLQVGSAPRLAIVDSAPTLSGNCGDIDPLGITGTPVIDAKEGELFATEETVVGADSWRDVRHWLVAISLSSHRELWHRDADPPQANTTATYYIPAEQQRAAVTLAAGRLYVAFGGLDGDCGQYHGYVTSVPESGVGALDTYRVPTQREGAIWETNGIVVAPDGDLYVATGNGSSNSLADFDEGNAVVELSPALRRLGVWAPANWVQLNDKDWDLGSAGPIQVPGTRLLFVTGKPVSNGSVGYLMGEGRLGGIGHGAFTGPVCPSGGAFGADASDVVRSGSATRILIFVPCGSGTEALQIGAATRTFRRVWAPSTGSPNGPPIVAGGIVWALDWNGNELYGMDPATGRVIFERATDALDHFATPSVAESMMLVPTTGGVEAFRTAG